MKLNQASISTLFGCATLLLTGCISSKKDYKHADFSGEKLYEKHGHNAPQLNENEVLALETKEASDAQIQEVLDATRNFSIKEGSTILLVQSGSRAPDMGMQNELSRDFRVVPESGIENEIRSGGESSLSNALRMTAARSGAETIMVYWGNVEMRRQELGTDIVSWLPVLDFTVPDEYHNLRLSLKVALVDVRTGKWITYNVEPIETDALSTRFGRKKQEPLTLNNLKKKAYATAAAQLKQNYTKK